MSANRTRVIIITRDFRIEGQIDLIQGARITDFMNEARKFMVVTDATVANHSEKQVLRGDFINVQVANIEIILPAESES